MAFYPRPIIDLITQFTRLPGIGPKTAERLVIHLASLPKSEMEKFAQALLGLSQHLVTCSNCRNYSDSDPCAICRNSSRDAKLLCVVSKPQDLIAIERTGNFLGRYHILGGTVNPLDGVPLERLNVKKLLERIQQHAVREVVLAFSPDLAGESTMLALKNVLQPIVQKQPLKITKLARGLPLGSDVEYADEATLSNALQGRREI